MKFLNAAFLFFALSLVSTAQAATIGEPAPDFGDWPRLYLLGLGLIVVQTVLLVGTVIPAAVVAASVGDTSGGAVIGLWFLGWLYVVPWSIAVYGHSFWRGFLERDEWRWLVSPKYLVTMVVATVMFLVGYVVVLLSLLTLVGWLFVGFLLVSVLTALVGQRYYDYAESRMLTGSNAADSTTAAGSTAATSSTAAADETDSDAARTDTDSTESDPHPTESDYTRLRERAWHVEREGGLEWLEADDDDSRVQFVSLATEESEAVDAFERAVDRWEGISGSEGVTTVYDRGDEPTPWVAYEPLNGSLRTISDLSPGGVLAVTGAVADAITTGRRYNIAHGAVRPACVFVERDGGSGPAADRIDATVGDWELQRDLASVTDTVELPARYCAPEQFGDGPTDDAVDVYQLAATAHYALFGQPPFQEVEPTKLEDPERSVTWQPPDGWHMADETVAVFERALATDPADRHDSPRAFHRALHRTLLEES